MAELKLSQVNDVNINETSYFGTTITTTINKLVEAIGSPEYDEPDENEKVQVEWTLLFLDEDDDKLVATIYDWKEYREYDRDEEIEFHIGGYSPYETNRVKNWIENKLKKS